MKHKFKSLKFWAFAASFIMIHIALFMGKLDGWQYAAVLTTVLSIYKWANVKSKKFNGG